jgi:peptidylprolyl isomerase
LLAAALLLAPAGTRAAEPSDPVVAQAGAVTVTASQVRAMLDAADPEVREQLRRDPNLLKQRVLERLMQLVLLQKAEAEKWDSRPEVAYRAELAREGAIIETYLSAQAPNDPAFPTDKDIATAYEANKAKLQIPRQYRLAQIMVALAPDAPAQAVSEAQARAAELRKQTVDGRKDFAALAKDRSDDKRSGANGGELGWVREDTLVPAIRQVLAAMTAGSVSEPVRTPDGWHVLKLIAVKPAGQATLAEAHDTLVRALRQERAVQLQRRYLAELREKQPMSVNEIELQRQAAQ